MAYATSDLRSQMESSAPKAPAGPAAAPEYFSFAELEPDEVTAAGSRRWIVRSQNAVIVYIDAVAGDRFVHSAPEESVFLLTTDSEVVVGVGDERIDVTEASVVMVPPGDGYLEMISAGVVTQLFTVAATDIADKARNAESYVVPHNNVAPLVPWPEPTDGFRLRTYALADYERDPALLGRIFRSSTFMVNYFYPSTKPRPSNKLSPHHHDDFEQISLQLAGRFVHHIRTPWTNDSAEWREDEHQELDSPGVTIIPPPTVHTSEWRREEDHLLIDIFCGPRLDFSRKAGWVRNAEDYPMPDEA